MGRIPRVATAGGASPEALAQQLDLVVRVVDEQIEFGEPQNPADPTDTTLAGVDHNGTVANVAGSWVEVQLSTSGTTEVTCTHNLFLNSPNYVVPVAGEPNCRWLVFGIMHNGTAADASSGIAVGVSHVGGAVTANAIDLRFNVSLNGTTVTVDGSNPVRVSLFFTKATRGEP